MDEPLKGEELNSELTGLNKGSLYKVAIHKYLISI